MKTHAMTAVLVAACAAGCTPSYRVHVSTYTESDRSVSPGAAIYVAPDPNAANPILRRSIESRIRELLQGYGYNPVETPDDANYVLTFSAGVNAQRVVDYATSYQPYGGFYGGFRRGFGGVGLGYTAYRPYISTVYTHWLRMRLLARDRQVLTDADVVWIGEAVTGTDSPELREVVNYLLVAGMEHFPVDTRRWVTVRIRADDPRILGIRASGENFKEGILFR